MKHLRIIKTDNCKHCGEPCGMPCTNCGGPVCYDCARVSANRAHYNEPVCQDCKENERWADFVVHCEHAELSDADGDGPCSCALKEGDPIWDCNYTTCPRKEEYHQHKEKGE